MDDDNRKSVQWHCHESHLKTMLNQQLKSGRFSDITLVCDNGQLLRAHRSVLCACSTYFDHILNSSTSDKETIVIMRECKFTELKLLLEYMYNGVISVDRVSNYDFKSCGYFNGHKGGLHIYKIQENIFAV